eukprot:SAG22_NODE_155_length_17123_cov_37.528489_19_plen_210_part_00
MFELSFFFARCAVERRTARNGRHLIPALPSWAPPFCGTRMLHVVHAGSSYLVARLSASVYAFPLKRPRDRRALDPPTLQACRAEPALALCAAAATGRGDGRRRQRRRRRSDPAAAVVDIEGGCKHQATQSRPPTQVLPRTAFVSLSDAPLLVAACFGGRCCVNATRSFVPATLMNTTYHSRYRAPRTIHPTMKMGSPPRRVRALSPVKS